MRVFSPEVDDRALDRIQGIAHAVRKGGGDLADIDQPLRFVQLPGGGAGRMGTDGHPDLADRAGRGDGRVRW